MKTPIQASLVSNRFISFTAKTAQDIHSKYALLPVAKWPKWEAK